MPEIKEAEAVVVKLGPPPEEWKQRLAWNIKAARLRRKLSRADLARIMKSPRQWLYKLESGASVPNVRTVLRVADALKMPAADLFKGVSAAPIPPEPWLEELLENIFRVPKSDWPTLLRIADDLERGQMSFEERKRIGGGSRLMLDKEKKVALYKSRGSGDGGELLAEVALATGGRSAV